jgi:hypothetical protein
MREFFDKYIAVPLGLLLFLLIAPTMTFGGLAIAFHLAGYLPEMGICRKVEK